MQDTSKSARSSPGKRLFRITVAGLLFLSPMIPVGIMRAETQDQGVEKNEKVEEGPPPLPGIQEQAGGSDLRHELVELFGKVERNLMEIDIKLSDAGAGDAILEGVPDAGLDDLLRAAQKNGEEARSQIDRILEIAAALDRSKSKGSSQSKPGESPIDQERQQGPQKRENTPEAPKPEKEGEKEEPTGETKAGDSQPKDSRKEDPSDRKNTPSDPPADKPGRKSPHDSEADRWGFLPPRQRETFRNQGRDDLPVQYRQWIDTYYRRLNREQG